MKIAATCCRSGWGGGEPKLVLAYWPHQTWNRQIWLFSFIRIHQTAISADVQYGPLDEVTGI
jgi:hypothetical protein